MCVYIYPVDIIPKHTQFDWRVPVHYCFQSHVRIQVRGEYVMGGYIDWGANLWILLSTRLCMCGMKVSVYVLNVYVKKARKANTCAVFEESSVGIHDAAFAV